MVVDKKYFRNTMEWQSIKITNYWNEFVVWWTFVRFISVALTGKFRSTVASPWRKETDSNSVQVIDRRLCGKHCNLHIRWVYSRDL